MALDASSACLSVFTATKSTLFVPERTIRLTTLLPPAADSDNLNIHHIVGRCFESKGHNLSPYIFFGMRSYQSKWMYLIIVN